MHRSRPLIVLSVLLGVSTPSFAGLVWESTFASGTDGVVDVRTDNPAVTMIGGNTGNALSITTTGRTVTPSNKAGRSVGATNLTANDSFSAYYKWQYTGYQSDGTNDVQELAGFVSSESQHSTRQMMGAALVHYQDSDGNYLIQFGARWASEGNTGSGRLFKGTGADVNFGTNPPIGQTLQIALGYDGSNHLPGTTTGGFLTASLYDSTGTLLKSVGDYIRNFDNLGVAPTDSALDAEVNQLSLGYVGWSDFIDGATSDKTHTWSVSDLAYYNDATGAFARVPEPTAALLLLAAVPLIWSRRNRKGLGGR